MDKCKICNLPAGKFNVILDSNGICNFCSFWEKYRGEFTNYKNLEKLMFERFDKVRGKYPYDALVGFSGGKDSAYVLYHLVKKHKLKVLALTYENGFLNDYGRRNIEEIVAELGVDHMSYQADWELNKKLYKETFYKLGDPCIGCALPMYWGILRLCFEKRIPYFVHGRSPYQMSRNLCEGTKDILAHSMMENMKNHSFSAVYDFFVKMDQQARTWLEFLFEDETERQQIYKTFFIDPRHLDRKFVPEFLGYFAFTPYDEKGIKDFLEKETGYKRPADDHLLSHDDCAIHEAASYIFAQINGLDPNYSEAAVMLRRGELTKDQAEVLIAVYNEKGRCPTDSIEHMCKKLDMKRCEFDNTVENLKKCIDNKVAIH